MLTIVWDVDDVLNELMRNWFEHSWLPEHQACKVSYKALIKNPPHEILGASMDEYLRSLDAFRLSNVAINMPPNPEIERWFQQNGHKFRHVALTATPIRCAPSVASWVFGNFGNWIRSFGFVPSKRDNDPNFSYDRSKKEYLQWWGRADILIDDNPQHVEDARRLGISTFLVSRPWNQAGKSIAVVLESLNRFL